MPNLDRRSVLLGAGAAGLTGLLGSTPAAATANRIEQLRRANEQFIVGTTQPAGSSVLWILPGPRRIDPHVFRTLADGPRSPQRADDGINYKIWYD